MNTPEATVTPSHPTSQPRKARDLIPVMVHISGIRRGTTERLSGKVVRISPGADGSIALLPPDESTDPEYYATLHSARPTYELAVAPGHTIWVNGEKVESQLLASGDLLEIGAGGPVLRFRLYPPDAKVYKSVSEAFADCVDCARHEGHTFPGRISLFLTRMVKEITTQTSLRFRVVLFSLVAVLVVMLVVTTVLLTRHSLDLEQRLAQEQSRVSGLTDLINRVQNEAFDRQELVDLRNAIEDDLSATVQRLEQLEARSTAVSHVIAAATQSTVFIQGSFGFEDPKSGRPLRLLVGQDGQALRTRQGIPAVTLEGDGPLFEIQYTGTAFLIGPQGQLVTNRHVAIPWENETSYQGIAHLGLKPVTRRLIGYLPGIEESFDVKLVAASDQADVAVLSCSDVAGLRPPLRLSQDIPAAGDEVIVLGYPTGIRALLARTSKAFVNSLSEQKDLDFWSIASHLAVAGHISPLATSGIVGQVTTDAIVYDAETTRGGSGGPVLNLNGEVVAVNAAILPEFGGSNLGVPVQHLGELVSQSDSPD